MLLNSMNFQIECQAMESKQSYHQNKAKIVDCVMKEKSNKNH